MRKSIIILILLIFSLIMLYGCSDRNSIKDDEYEGKTLQIAIVSDSSLPKFNNVNYINIELDSLTEDNKKYDALIITKDGFLEADKDKYVSFFNNLQYPVFFFGIQGFRDFAFTTNGIDMDMTKDKDSAYVQGFKNDNNENRQQWKFHLPGDSKKNKNNLDKEMLLKIFKVLNNTNSIF